MSDTQSLQAQGAPAFGGYKVVHARPMTAADAVLNGYRPGQMSNDAPGYEVEYEGGYRSWSPKDVFDQAYDQLSVDDQIINQAHLNMLRHFDSESRLPEPVRELVKPFKGLAWRIARRCTDPVETTVALRKLLDARDGVVRAMGA